MTRRSADTWSVDDEERLAILAREGRREVENLSGSQRAFGEVIAERERSLDDQGLRGQLVRARDTVRDIIDGATRLEEAQLKLDRISRICGEMDSIADEYVTASISDVEGRFATISDLVDRYFSALESDTPGLARPRLRLLRDQDRAVVLEIEFRGERIDQAYGYLSQSQLNSFGLAVFLASARIGNTAFPFLVLDDVINSFDAYKRPRLAELLRTEFSDFQLVVLTHDQVWWDRLARECPDWIRLRFSRYEPGSGPLCQEALSSLEEIGRFIEDDRPELAGRSLGPLMELNLQEIAEGIEAYVAYNRRNEYTLRAPPGPSESSRV